MIGTVYRSNLKAMLILPKIQLPFTTMEQLAATDIQVVAIKGSLVDHAVSVSDVDWKESFLVMSTFFNFSLNAIATIIMEHIYCGCIDGLQTP